MSGNLFDLGEDGLPSSWLFAGTTVAAAAFVFVILSSSKDKKKSDEPKQDPNIPTAPGAVPILGHALAYKKNPPQFLESAADFPLFRVNLAGRRMILVGADAGLEWQMAKQPESIFSSHKAVAQVGFDYTLGEENVFFGTDFHKRLLKNHIWSDWNGFTRNATRQCRVALQWVIRNEKSIKKKTDTNEMLVPDLFTLTRKTMLRTILSVFCGTCMVQDSTLIDDFMVLQDKIEDATAAGAVLPRWVANPLVFGPVRQSRYQVQEKMSRIIEAAQKQKKRSNDKKDDDQTLFYGPWLQSMEEEGMETSKMAELIVGFVFAAHKNAAIGAAQSYCHLLEYGDQKVATSSSTLRQCVDKEAVDILQRKERPSISWDELERLAPTIRACCYETTRITAHSIGSIREVCRETILTDSEGRSYTVYPGETIAASHYLYNTNPKHFAQKGQYQPTVNGNSNTRSTKDESKESAVEPRTFSAGVHKCPGERIALILMEYLVALLLERKARLDNTMPPVSFERATLAQRDGPVAVVLSSGV